MASGSYYKVPIPDLPIETRMLEQYCCLDQLPHTREEEEQPTTNNETRASLFKRKQNFNEKGRRRFWKQYLPQILTSWLYLAHGACFERYGQIS